jgi:succinate dehydrogenase / fumarate reductase membrane anchor subunit
MSGPSNIGSKRLVVGAHYGFSDWLAQRISAIVIGVYTLIVLVAFFSARDFSYEGWAGLFSHQWMKVATFVAFIALFYHAWIGLRDIWMDYIQPAGLKLTLEVLTIIWLVGCAGYAAQILWRA